MDKQLRGILLSLSLVFVLAFAGITFAALATAQLNFASILAFGLSFLVIVTALIGLVGVIRNPPDEDD